MTVKQLKEALQKLPDNMDVYLAETTSEFAYSPAESCIVKRIPFQEEPGGKTEGDDTVCIISDN